MKTDFRDGKIVVTGKYHENVVYDVCANDLRVKFDGKGGITNYTVSNQGGNYIGRSFLLVFSDGKKLDAFADKTVELVGRTQKIILTEGDLSVEIFQFVPPVGNAVFYRIEANRPGDYDFVLDLGHGGKDFGYAADVESEFVSENASVYMRTDRVARIVFSCGAGSERCREMLSRFSEYEKRVTDEYETVAIPATAKTEEDKALYVSSIFAALENYKEVGNYKGFSAGCNYTAPVRTYFRDSYWTVLSMYRDHPDLVRNQILTLAYGIDENGDCPSAVTFELLTHWGNHFDSPSFFVMMVYDYINRTGDFSILDETVGGKTVYDYCLLVVNRLSESTDETRLVFKAGKYNKRDWADEVNRVGYVTYVELLYARALYCLSRIVGKRDAAQAGEYREAFLAVKDAINRLLWDDEKGYYINYKTEDFVEDNLSVDTILAVLFGISDKTRTERILDNVSSLLESRNNGIQRAGDFGVMSVFPFYRGIDRARNKSSQEYEYHNGAVWPYLSALVAYAQMRNGRDYSYALTSSFDWNIAKGNYTPIEYYSPIRPDGSLLQAWSSDAAWVYDWRDVDFFAENEAVWKTE